MLKNLKCLKVNPFGNFSLSPLKVAAIKGNNTSATVHQLIKKKSKLYRLHLLLRLQVLAWRETWICLLITGLRQYCLAQDVPQTPEGLRLHRNTLTMELVWIQQAIDSRKKVRWREGQRCSVSYALSAVAVSCCKKIAFTASQNLFSCLENKSV